MTSVDDLTKALTPEGWVSLYFVIMSSVCAFLMLIDKFRAERDLWRIPEMTLLAWAFFGGALGGKLAQKLVRHKTRKQPFAHILNKWVVWNLIFYAAAFTPALREPALSGLSELTSIIAANV